MKKYKSKHKTKNIAIITADVDINIISLVNYINSFQDIVTEFSCEGFENESNGYLSKPNVIFSCYSQDNLYNLLSKLNIIMMPHSGWFQFYINVSYDRKIRYNLIIKDVDILKEINKKLSKLNKNEKN